MESFLDLKNIGETLAGLSLAGGQLRWQAVAVGLIIAVVLLVLFSRRSRLMMRSTQRVTLVVMTALSLALLGLSFTELTHTEREKRLSVALLVDASASVPDQELARAQQWVEQAYAERGEAWVRTILFGRTPAVLSAPDEQAPPLLSRPESDPGTNIARALHAAMELFPEKTVRRALLITDGNQTEGDLLGEASSAAAHGIELYAMTLDTREVRDAFVESIHVPAAARPGERVKVGAVVVSNYATPARIAITQAGRRIFSQNVQLEPGRTTFETEAVVSGGGSNVFAAQVGATEDSLADNNRLSASLRVVSQPRVIVFSQEPDLDLPLVEALTAARLDVQIGQADTIPTSMHQLAVYDEVILSDLTYESLSNKKQKALMSYAREGGGGVLITGGPNTGYLAKKEAKLPIKRMMPVIFKQKKKTEPNPATLILVIDKSASMSRERKFAMAIQAACDVIDLLPERSRLGIILFDDYPRWAIPLQRVDGPENRQKMKNELRSFGVDGGTSIYPAIADAYKKLKNDKSRVKHIILLSDGLSLTTFTQWGHIIRWMAAKKITISAVALGKESDKKHLQQIAEVGRGRFYYTETAADIPRIFLEETKTITKTNVVEKKFVPELLKRGDLLNDLNLPPIPELLGYNTSEPKPTSEVFLTADRGEPLLVRWRYGLGKVTLLLTDTGQCWARSWREWDEYARLMASLVHGTLPDLALRNYRLQAETVEDLAQVSVDVTDQYGNFANDMDLRLQVTDPNGEQMESVALQQVRPGGYEGLFTVGQFGSYSLRVVPRGGQAVRSQGAGRVHLTPPREFVATAPNRTLLSQVSLIGSGKIDPTVAEVFAEPEVEFPKPKPLWNYLLYVALGSLLITLLVRRS